MPKEVQDALKRVYIAADRYHHSHGGAKDCLMDQAVINNFLKTTEQYIQQVEGDYDEYSGLRRRDDD